jgi:hypothetical protein
MSRDKKMWDQAIEDAKDTIAKCERKIQSMKGTIEILQDHRDRNEPWPGVNDMRERKQSPIPA